MSARYLQGCGSLLIEFAWRRAFVANLNHRGTTTYQESDLFGM